jgi:hypothetical protein
VSKSNASKQPEKIKQKPRLFLYALMECDTMQPDRFIDVSEALSALISGLKSKPSNQQDGRNK